MGKGKEVTLKAKSSSVSALISALPCWRSSGLRNGAVAYIPQAIVMVFPEMLSQVSTA